jgi:hypothetical protein
VDEARQDTWFQFFDDMEPSSRVAAEFFEKLAVRIEPDADELEL